MPKISQAKSQARKDSILDAAELCFAEKGFHQATMQDICKKAKVSAGTLYIYFPSKESIIEGLCERDRAELAEKLSALMASDDLTHSLTRMIYYCAAERPQHKRRFFVEMTSETMRNPVVHDIFFSMDTFVMESLERLLKQAIKCKRIKPSISPQKAVSMLMLIAEGVMIRAAIDPTFKLASLLPTISAHIHIILNEKHKAKK